MPSTAFWARYDPRIRLVVDGKEMPCTRCSVDYELNTIPQASATIAVGRTFDGVPSPAHALLENFVDRVPAQLYITPNSRRIDPTSATQPGQLGLAGTEVRIFDGFVTAASFTRSRGHAQLNVQMEHWLSEMGFSSIFSKTSHPANPGHYAYEALSPGGGDTGVLSNLDLAWLKVNATTIASDFWGDALKPYFQFLCENDSFVGYEAGIPPQMSANDGALAALARFNSPYQQPLAFDLPIDVDILVGIVKHVSTSLAEPGYLANQTLWDVLVAIFANEYGFKVVPRVEDAIVVPFIEGYRTSYTTITADEKTQIEWMRALGRTIRGVGILSGLQADTGFDGPGQPAPPKIGIGGFYSPYTDPSEGKGLIIIKPGPDWMASLYAPSLYGHQASGAAGNVIGTSVQPGAPKVNNVPDETKKRLDTVIVPFLRKYAQSQYALEKLRPRQAVCSGPFRLDIAPGSTVKIENEGELHIPGDPLKAPFYAHVARVSIVVDAEQPMIGTSFHLSHIRSEKENTLDMTSVEKHPFYQETFAGAPLVDLDV